MGKFHRTNRPGKAIVNANSPFDGKQCSEFAGWGTLERRYLASYHSCEKQVEYLSKDMQGRTLATLDSKLNIIEMVSAYRTRAVP